MYNASSNELVRTKTLVKGGIVQVDATPFRQWYEAHYGTALARKAAKADEKAKKGKKVEAKSESADAAPADAAASAEEKKKSKRVLRKLAARKKTSKLDQALIDQFATGRLYGNNFILSCFSLLFSSLSFSFLRVDYWGIGCFSRRSWGSLRTFD